MSVKDVEANAVDLVQTLTTYMQLNERGFASVGKKLEEKLYTHNWQEVSEAFENLLGKAGSEALKAEMKKRFESLKKENFAQDSADTPQVASDNIQDTPKQTEPEVINQEEVNKENHTQPVNETGDTTMADENNIPNTEETTFVPTEGQKYACGYLGIKIENYKDNDSLVAAIKEAALVQEDFDFKDDKLIILGGAAVSIYDEQNPKEEEGKQQPVKEEEAAKEGSDKENKDETKPVNIDGETNTPPAPNPNTNEDAPEIADWIKRKIENYQKMAKGEIEGCPKLEGYKHDESIKDGFAADFNGGHIHYSSPDSVTVSKESGLKVFEVLVSEPDNNGRPVNFGPNLDHEQAVKLMAACLLHDNPVGENAPKLSEADIKAIEAELKDRPKDLAKFQEKIVPYLQAQQQNTDSNEGEQPKTEEPKEKSFDDETKKQIKEALNNQYEMAAMENSGKVHILGNGEGAVLQKDMKNCTDDEFAKYGELKGKQDADKKFLAEKFIENPDGMRAIVSEMIKEKTNGHTKQSELTDQEKTDLATVRQTQISALRDKMAKTADGNSDQLMEHDKRILALSGRLNEGDKAFVTKNGEKQEVKALEGEAKERFEARNKDAIARALENYKFNTK